MESKCDLSVHQRICGKRLNGKETSEHGLRIQLLQLSKICIMVNYQEKYVTEFM